MITSYSCPSLGDAAGEETAINRWINRSRFVLFAGVFAGLGEDIRRRVVSAHLQAGLPARQRGLVPEVIHGFEIYQSAGLVRHDRGGVGHFLQPEKIGEYSRFGKPNGR